jgi:hypothetical protein
MPRSPSRTADVEVPVADLLLEGEKLKTTRMISPKTDGDDGEIVVREPEDREPDEEAHQPGHDAAARLKREKGQGGEIGVSLVISKRRVVMNPET